MAATPKGDLRANGVPWPMVEAVNAAAAQEGVSVRAWIVQAVQEKLDAQAKVEFEHAKAKLGRRTT